MNISITTKSVQDLKSAMDSQTKIVILDVRTEEEYKRGHIEGSINIPVDQIENKVTTLVSDKTDMIYVYCLSGSRSILAVSQMISLGYTNVYDVSHGLLAWRIGKYPLFIPNS